MNKNLRTLFTAAALALGTIAPGLSYATGPNLMVFGDDADKDTVPRSSRVFKRVINALRSQMDDRGFDVFDETAVTIREGYKQGKSRRTDVEILDIAQSQKRPPIDVAVMFQIYANAKDKGYTTKVRTRIAGHMLSVQSGRYLGDFEVKKLYNAPAECNRECILEVVGDKSRLLGEDLGDVLATKLAHLVDGGGSQAGYVSGGMAAPSDQLGGMSKEYNLEFNNFTSDERLDIEEYLTIFSGYQHHRPTDCSRRRCTYWYQSTISSAKLQRNIHRMLNQLDMEANVVFEGNNLKVDRITLRQDRPSKPYGGGW